MVYRLLEERSKKGAGRSMRALACRVCAWVLPLYRNLEPITRKPLGGGSGDTSLEQSSGDEDQACTARPRDHGRLFPPVSHRLQHCIVQKGEAEGTVGLAVLTPLPAPLNPLLSLSSQPGATDSPEECVVLNADLPQPLG